MQDSTRFKIPLKSKPIKDKIPFNNKHVSHTVLHVSVANFIISLINFRKRFIFITSLYVSLYLNSAQVHLRLVLDDDGSDGLM
jgi:hypothetical protein